MKTIIAATDFSAAATNAARYAADMAVFKHADLLLVNVWQLPINYDGMVTPLLSDDLMEDAKRNMKALEETLENQSKRQININSKIAVGDFFTEFEKICNDVKPDVVVMGSQGSTAMERAVFGGHTVHAMKKLGWPLITVPSGVCFSAIKKIGLACDFKKVQDVVPVDELTALVKEFGASLHVLNTGKKEAFDPDIVFQSEVLQDMLGGLKPEYHFIEHEKVEEGIMDFAEKNKIDLLVILPRHHHFLDKLIHKSHTKQIVLHSHVPVMALHE